ncbi:hypothetical protein C5167_000883 [Papaver somniferum]|uniref:Uncharacterized protein n=1 Tax=Papaver somniferum TaxID=3469 RepID=A0A4Y7KWJ8_PAPSO|nr:filaggrin-2-like [Papaver somniferum]RZC76730.1 hypothetical protein C5167_000883 [Papaver somniferum]
MMKKKMTAAFLFFYLIFSCLFIRISACGDGPRAGEISGGSGHKYNHTNDSRIPTHGSNTTSGGRSVGESSGGFGQKYNHTKDSKIAIHGSNSTGGGRSTGESSSGFGQKYNHTNDTGESSSGFGQKYNHTNDSKIAVHTSNTAASNNCSIQSSNSTSTDSPRSGSIMIRQHKGTDAFTFFVTLTAIILVIY